MNIEAYRINQVHAFTVQDGEILVQYFPEIELSIPRHLRLVTVFPQHLTILWGFNNNLEGLQFATPISLYMELETRNFRLAFASPHGDVWCNQFFDERPVL